MNPWRQGLFDLEKMWGSKAPELEAERLRQELGWALNMPAPTYDEVALTD